MGCNETFSPRLAFCLRHRATRLGAEETGAGRSKVVVRELDFSGPAQKLKSQVWSPRKPLTSFPVSSPVTEDLHTQTVDLPRLVPLVSPRFISSGYLYQRSSSYAVFAHRRSLHLHVAFVSEACVFLKVAFIFCESSVCVLD